MLRVKRLSLLTLLLLAVLPVLAQGDPAILITPESGAAGTAIFTLDITGLTADADYTVDFIYEESGEVIFSSPETATADGGIRFSIRIEAEDPPGEYLAEVKDDSGVVVVEGAFTVTEAGADLESTDNILIDPETGPIGTTHVITVAGLPEETDVTVEIQAIDTGDVTYRRTQTTSGSGRLRVEIFSEDGDIPGQYSVTVTASDGTVLAVDEFTIEALPERNPIISLNPLAAPATTSRMLSVNGLQPFDRVNINILVSGAATLIESFTIRADVDGNVDTEVMLPEDTEDGSYTLEVSIEGIKLAGIDLVVGDEVVTLDETIVRVSPETGPFGTQHTITVNGLEEGELYKLAIVGSENSAEIYSIERFADENGNTSVTIITNDTDTPGDYVVQVSLNDEVLAESNLTIEGDIAAQPADEGDVTIIVTPDAGPRGTEYLIEVAGLEADESITLDVSFADESVFSTTENADADGNFSFPIITEDSDEVGDYTVIIRRGDEIVAQTTFSVTEGEVVEEESTLDPEVGVSVTPGVGDIGEMQTIDVSGLVADETVTLNILYNEDSIQSTEETADEEGNLSLEFSPEADSELGDYSVHVLREDVLIAESMLTVADLAPATVTVSPEAGPRGTSHMITITDLHPNEDVTVDIVFGPVEATEYTTDRTADDNGEIMLEVSSNEGDTLGVYRVRVLRTGQVVGENTLSITRGEAPATTVQSPREVIPGEVIDGILSGTQSQGVHNFTGEAGEVVAISLSSPDFDAYLILQDEAGLEIARDDDSGGDLNSLLAPYTLPYDGTYTIVATSYSAQQSDERVSGVYELTISRIETQLIEYTQTVATRFTRGNPFALYTFTGGAGDIVSLSAMSDTFDTTLILKDDTDAELLRDEDVSSPGALIGPYVLPYTGEYTVFVQRQENAGFTPDGDVTLRLERAAITAVSYGEVQAVTFEGDRLFEYFSFEANAGDVVDILADSGGTVDTLLRLTGPDNFEVASDDDSGAGLDPEISQFVADTSGTYLVTLQSFTMGTTGDVTLTINRQATRSLDESSQQITLNSKNYRGAAVFEGAAGEQITLTVRVLGGSPTDTVISATQHGMEVMNYMSMGIPGEIILGFVVPQNGIISIVVEETSFGSSVLELSIERK